MSQEGKVLIQSSNSIQEAMDLTGRTEPILFHGFVSVQPTEEYHWEVVIGDEFLRVLARLNSYHFFNPADQWFKHLPTLSCEAWRRLDLVLTDLSVSQDIPSRVRRVTVADCDWHSGDVRVFGENDEILGVHNPLAPWS